MVKKVTVNTLQKCKDNNEKFSVLTAYDYSTAKYLDEAGIDVILIGDSLAMVALGYETTHAVGADEMAIFTRAVAKGVERAFVITDMPFLSYHTNISDAVKNCGLGVAGDAHDKHGREVQKSPADQQRQNLYHGNHRRPSRIADRQ